MFEASGWFLGGELDGEKFNSHLNRLGEESWELVSVFDTNVQGGRSRDIVAVLKRPMKQRQDAVHSMIVTLEKRGLVLRTPGAARSIRLLLNRDQLPDLK